MKCNKVRLLFQNKELRSQNQREFSHIVNVIISLMNSPVILNEQQP